MTAQTPAERRAFLIRQARRDITDARSLRHTRATHALLLIVAAMTRRLAQQIDTSPQQREMAL
ncbi:MAG: hypothetical protein ACK4NW_02070 [Roseinatronobacter sp.]